MNRFKRLVVEAHRRSLWQVLGIYLVGSWIGYSVVQALTEGLGLPDWVPGLAVVLFIIGLPIVLATAFVQEGAPLISKEAPAWAPPDPTLFPSSDITGQEPAETAPVRGRHHFMLTWQKAILAGVVAFLLLGLTAGGYMGLRNAGVGPFGSLVASGALDSRERILIADFASSAADSGLAAALTQAFRVDFAQTPVVTVVQPAYVREVLQRMSRDPKSPLDAELAREVAIRDNIKAYVAGELAAAGGSYVLTAQLVNAKDASVLASFRETAADASQIIPTVDKLSKQLRAKIGESLKTIRREKPLEAVSTPSLEALLKYTQAVRALDVEGDEQAAMSLLEEALAIDSTFAMAWRKLAAVYSNANAGEEKRMDAARKAYHFRERLTDSERYQAEGYYHTSITRDWNKAINAYQMAMERDPAWAPNNLSIAYQNVRDFRKAAEAAEEAIRRDSMLFQAHVNAIASYLAQGDSARAEQAWHAFDRRFPNLPVATWTRGHMLASRGDYDGAAAAFQQAGELRRNSPFWRGRTEESIAITTAVRGRIADAEQRRERAAAANAERGQPWDALEAELYKVGMDISVRRDPERARKRLDAVVARADLESIPRMDRPYWGIAINYARLGDAAKAREWLNHYERDNPVEYRTDDRQPRLMLGSHVAIVEGRYTEAVDLARRAAEIGSCVPCFDAEVAAAFERAGMPDSAVARYEHYLTTPSPYRAFADAFLLGTTYERLAELYEARGDGQKARYYAAKFVELWKDADADLQPRVRAKQRLLQQRDR